jgi:hypothetical protein
LNHLLIQLWLLQTCPVSKKGTHQTYDLGRRSIWKNPLNPSPKLRETAGSTNSTQRICNQTPNIFCSWIAKENAIYGFFVSAKGTWLITFPFPFYQIILCEYYFLYG